MIMTHSLDMDGMRAFVAVVEAMSFSRAAERVGRSQSAVSLQLARLERMLGKTLVRRRQGRVDGLTDDGLSLLPYARRMVDLNDSAWRVMAAPAVSGRVRLGVPADFMDAHFPEMLGRFLRAYPGIALEVMSDTSARLRERAAAGALDVAFFKCEPRDTAGATVVARQQVVWAGNRVARPDNGDELALVLFPEGCAYRRAALDALAAAGRSWRVAYASPGAGSVRAAILAGLGIGALPLTALDDDLVDIGDCGLPDLAAIDLAMAFSPAAGDAARVLADHVARRLDGRSGG